MPDGDASGVVKAGMILFLSGGSSNIVFPNRLERHVSQHEESGWFSVTTCLDVSASLCGDSSSGELGFLAEAPDFSVLGDVISPGRSALSMHVEVDVLFKMATKPTFHCMEGGRFQGSSSGHRRR